MLCLPVCLHTGRVHQIDLITDGCEPSCGCWELTSELLKEQPVLLTPAPSPQAHPQASYLLYFSLIFNLKQLPRSFSVNLSKVQWLGRIPYWNTSVCGPNRCLQLLGCVCIFWDPVGQRKKRLRLNIKKQKQQSRFGVGRGQNRSIARACIWSLKPTWQKRANSN